MMMLEKNYFLFTGLRVLDGPLTDGLEATAFNKNMQINDIYSCRSVFFLFAYVFY